ncbi:MAG: adenylate/guanylate cyclase domain-containing protein [Lentisphaeria bacterium]|nr:adenylate/guanylate cyclase domain-containing protein [Lentisphaeria bacterium]
MPDNRKIADDRTKELDRLCCFLDPQVAKVILSEDSARLLAPHEREITVVFVDLRNFTSYVDSHTPEQVFQLVGELYEVIGPVVSKHGGTVERFTGDGIMAFFGDPISTPDHALRAVHMAIETRQSVEALEASWRQAGYDGGLGIGIATGMAALGAIGFDGRYDYAALGAPTSLAARLCSEASVDQILVGPCTAARVDGEIDLEGRGTVQLKGFRQVLELYEVPQGATAT